MTSTPRAPDQDDPALRRLERKLEEARKELLETSTRSRLLHTPLGSRRAKIVQVKDELFEQVFRILVADSKPISFLPAPENGEEKDDGTIELPQPEDGDEGGVAHRHTDSRLQTALSSAKLQARLRSISYDAQTFENEQGVNILYLALGFLKWFDPKDPENPRYAPLILVPVTLTRVSANERFKVAYSGEELGTNLSLQQRLKDEGVELPDLPDIEDVRPSAYTAAVASSVAGMSGWEVLPNVIVLGFFSFAKLMMYRDLEPKRWPQLGGLRDHPLIGGLLGDGFRGQGDPLLPDDTRVDGIIDISNAGHVVDADSSQMLAIEEVGRGRNLVIQGPPGTGKSQTITNLICSAVRGGQRVLFVAEKMAALNVVRSNLDRIGLGQICLELHSHRAKKKTVLEDLEQTYQLTGARHTSVADIGDELRTMRDVLNGHVERMHKPLEPSALTPFQIFGALARLSGRGFAPPDFQLPVARSWNRRDIDQRAQRLERLAAPVSAMGVPAEHPSRGSGLDVLLPQDAVRLAGRTRAVSELLSDVIGQGCGIANQIGAGCETWAEAWQLVRLGQVLVRAPKLDGNAVGAEVWISQRSHITELVEFGTTYANARGRLEGVLVPEAWDEDLAEIRRTFGTHGTSWLRWLNPEYRAALARFRGFHLGAPPKLVSGRMEILQMLSTGQSARRQVRALDALGAAAFGTIWAGDVSDWALLRAIESWERRTRELDLPHAWQQRLGRIGDLQAYAHKVAAFAGDLSKREAEVRSLLDELSFDLLEAFEVSELEALPLALLRDRLAAFAVNPESLQQWCTWRLWSREARATGLDDVVDRLADGRLPVDRAADVFRYACFESLARQAFAEHSEVSAFDGRFHDRVVAAFQKLDRERMERSRQEVATQHVALMPRGVNEIGEVGILAREWRKQRRHLPLRQLIKAAGRAMQHIKPVWMMSPMSLARFVEPGALQFDIVLMDEASQIRPVEALGAIARAQQVVVVGDDKQLPPTSFFDRFIAEEAEPSDPEEFQVADVESILGLCTSQGIPDRMLRWHYRSQHESLIAVSNLEFYRKLFIVPSAESEDLGLRFRRVNGVYDRGRTATNHNEAQAVARAVVEHARRYGESKHFPAGMSLGVGTFSVAQRDCILDQLERLWREDPDLAGFFDPSAPEPFFVKNLESIQGDERDVVFISVGYGPDESGYTAMQFGPLSGVGGERRLNVLISRARRRCEVFSSISAADIDLGRTQSIGVRVLKTFLQYAETGHLDRSQVGPRDPDSDFEIDVGMTLAGLGYLVEHQVGVAGFFVDLAIKDPEQPGRYLLGIECDGATYHSSRSARDRDRLREQVLRDRGWHIHRVWSTDWYRRRNQELQRVIAAIEAARSGGPSSPPPLLYQARSAAADGRSDIQPADVHTFGTDGSSTGSGYVEAAFLEQISVEPHELRLTRRVDILLRIIAAEGPIHEEEICRRFASVCGKDRAGNRIQESTRQGLAQALRERKIHADGPFYMVEPLAECPPRDRSAVHSTALRKPEMLPPVEIRTGLRQVVADHIGVEPLAAIVEVARMFGFQRTGDELHRVIEEQLRAMLGGGMLVLRNSNRLYLA